MDMDMSGMEGMGGMGSMDMGDGIPALPYLQKMYWTVIGSVIALAAVVNGGHILLGRQRLRKASTLTPARPRNVLMRAWATVTAITREVAYAVPPVVKWVPTSMSQATTGRVLLALANMIVLVVLCFYKLSPRDQWQWEDIGYRTGFMTICQLPLVFLLAGKNNIIGVLVGSSYERLNWLHRWTARTLFLTATIHMGFWFTSWARYEYIKTKLTTDPITQKGFAAWWILLWIMISSVTPIRGWSYEFFVLQHIVSFAAFLGVVYIHTPAEVHVWVWIPIGLVLLDRLVRTLLLAYHNLSIFHRRSGLLACRAELTPLSSHTTRITIQNPPFKWKPGQHVFLSCHSVVPLQSHPLTIASIPSDGKLEFLARARSGGTQRFLHHAEKTYVLPTEEVPRSPMGSNGVMVDGPYGRIRSLNQFDSVILFAGGVGATFSIPLLRDLVWQWTNHSQHPATRHIRLVWVVKGRGQLEWFSNQLNQAQEQVEQLRRQLSGVKRPLKLSMSVYVTCDDALTEQYSSSSSSSSSTVGSDVNLPSDEKTAQQTITSRSSSTGSSNTEAGCCGNNLTSGKQCCCTQTITKETSNSDSDSSAACQCNCRSVSTGMSKSSTGLHPSIPLLSGRPHVRNLIREVLEQARGETGVVVCGPAGLSNNVRRSVVSLSDERAVHKGTGAQGIWLHVEEFGY